MICFIAFGSDVLVMPTWWLPCCIHTYTGHMEIAHWWHKSCILPNTRVLWPSASQENRTQFLCKVLCKLECCKLTSSEATVRNTGNIALVTLQIIHIQRHPQSLMILLGRTQLKCQKRWCFIEQFHMVEKHAFMHTQMLMMTLFNSHVHLVTVYLTLCPRWTHSS